MQKVCLEVGLQERGSRKADEVGEEPGSDKNLTEALLGSDRYP